MYMIEIGRWIEAGRPRGIFCEDADPCGLMVGRWGVADESREEKKVRNLQDSDDSVVIF